MTAPSIGNRLRVVIAEDDSFSRSLVADGLRSLGYDVYAADSAESGLDAVAAHDPHVLVTDLNFGSGATGASLLADVRSVQPWVALVILTSHQSPSLAVDDAERIPADTMYIVKSQLKSVLELGQALEKAIGGAAFESRICESSAIVVSPGQAHVLRMLASGASVRAIAEHRGTTVRAAETMITRLYTALDLESDARFTTRVAAIQLWQQGRIRVKVMPDVR